MVNMLRAAEHFRDQQTLRRQHERQKWFIAARKQKEHREKIDDAAESALVDLVAAAVLVEPAEIKAFKVKLDAYDEATVKALMENQALLDAVNARIDEMLDRAHTLEDGRRVFKTRDGQSVYDEFGAKLSDEVVHPGSISDQLPPWEDLLDAKSERKKILLEREEIHEFQDKLDHARETADSDELTKDEFEELETDIEASIPQAVAKQMPGYQPTQRPVLGNDFSASTAILNPTNTPAAQPSLPTLAQ